MRKELKIIGSRDRHVFTATFIRFGFRDGYKGPVKTILLQDVLLDDKIVTDHLWFDLTKGFESADLLPGDVVLYIDKELAGKGIPIEAKNWNIKNEKEVVYPRMGVPVFMLKDIGIGFRTIEGATEVANLLVKYNAFKTESRYLAGSYEQFWIMKEGVCPAVKGETGYSKEEFDKIDEKNKNPELTSINTFNDTVKKPMKSKIGY